MGFKNILVSVYFIAGGEAVLTFASSRKGRKRFPWSKLKSGLDEEDELKNKLTGTLYLCDFHD